MNAYRLSGKVAGHRTSTVRVPEGASVGAEAEVIVLFLKRVLMRRSSNAIL